MTKLNRRNFVTGMASGLVGMALGKNVQAAPFAPVSNETEEPRIKQYNALGKTGLKLDGEKIDCVVSSSVRQYR